MRNPSAQQAGPLPSGVSSHADGGFASVAQSPPVQPPIASGFPPQSADTHPRSNEGRSIEGRPEQRANTSQGNLFESFRSPAHAASSSLSSIVSPTSARLNSPGVSRDEMNLAEFPLSVLSTRVDPKVKTLEFSDYQRGKDGELTERKWIITGADKFGLPTATDDDVILGLIRLTMDDGFRSRKVYFTRYELLRALQWSTEGRSYTRLVKSLDRLSGVRIRASNAFYDNSSKSYQTKNFGIIDAYELNDHRSVRKNSKRRDSASSRMADTHAADLLADDRDRSSMDGARLDGRDLGRATSQSLVVDQDSGKSFFIWSEMLFNSFRSGFIKKLDLDLYFSLRSSVSRRLYRYLDKHFYFKPSLERPLLFLAFEKLGISRNYKYVSSVKQQLEPAAEELLSVGYLSSFDFYGRGEQAMVRFCAAREGDPIRREPSAKREPTSASSASPQAAFGRQPSEGSHGAAFSQTGAVHSGVGHAGTGPAGGAGRSGGPFSGGRPPGSLAGGPAMSDPRRDDISDDAASRESVPLGEDEPRLRSQLIEALVSRGITISQAKRLLVERGLTELQHIDRIVSYYDHLVENHDSKISRNKVGFLYRAVENPVRFQIPASFVPGAQPQGQSWGSQTESGGGRKNAPLRENSSTSSADDPGLQQARLRQAYFEFVSLEVSRIMKSLPEKERDELRRRVEEKMSCLGTALSPERFEEAIQGCMREEISRTHNIPDFKRWAKRP